MADVDKAGYKGLAFMDAGFRSITATRPIYTPADLKGLKIRVMQSKPLIDTVNALGGNAVPMGQSEVYSALQTKVIDCWENNEPTVLSFNMQEVAKYYSYTRLFLHSRFLMNKRLFDGLPKNCRPSSSNALEAMEKHNKLWGEMNRQDRIRPQAKAMVFNR
jgi:TRAP-type C4-dicarboxylate transport system substrate-binding protein